MTIGKTKHLKMYLLLKMVIFQPVMLVFGWVSWVILYFVSRCEFGSPLNPSQVFASLFTPIHKVFGRLQQVKHHIDILSIVAPVFVYPLVFRKLKIHQLTHLTNNSSVE